MVINGVGDHPDVGTRVRLAQLGQRRYLPSARWTGPPKGTKSFALTVDDRDDRSGICVHWALYGISGTIRNSLKVSRGRTPCRGSEPRA